MNWMDGKQLYGVIAAVSLLAFSLCAQAEVKITQLANEGVIIDHETTRIMIDGMVVEPYALYGGLPPELAEEFRQARGLFAGVDLALASHRHHDHNQPEFACILMQRNPLLRMVTSPQVVDLMRERCRDIATDVSRVRMIDPQYGNPLAVREGDALVTIYRLSHGVGKYAKLQNFGHLVEVGGVKILHIGDAAMDPRDFETAGLQEEQLDVALIPFWFFQPGPGMEVVNRYMNARKKFAVHIPPAEVAEVSEYLAENFPEVGVLAEPGEFVDVIPAGAE